MTWALSGINCAILAGEEALYIVQGGDFSIPKFLLLCREKAPFIIRRFASGQAINGGTYLGQRSAMQSFFEIVPLEIKGGGRGYG